MILATLLLAGAGLLEQEIVETRRNDVQKYQEYFNNTYLVETLIGPSDEIEPNHKGTCSAYNFRDDKEQSYYVTAKHCLIPPADFDIKKVFVYDPTGHKLEAKVLKEGVEDYAILVSKKDDHKSKTKYCELRELVNGERAYIVGYPFGVFRYVKESNVAAIVRFDNKQPDLILDEGVNRGTSGGPSFVERNGDLCFAGIVVKVDDNYTFSINLPYDVMKEDLR